MKITPLLTDDAVLTELGERITARRLDMQLTQEALANQAGIGKRTLERMEAGHSSQLVSLVRVLRALQALPELESLLTNTGVKPMDLLKHGDKPRQRASTRRSKTESVIGEGSPWRWGDDT